MCDNNHGWGAGVCFARCCRLPGFQAITPGRGGRRHRRGRGSSGSSDASGSDASGSDASGSDASGSGKGKGKGKKGRRSRGDWRPSPPDETAIGRQPNPPVIKLHDNTPVLRLFTRNAGKGGARDTSVLQQWAKASRTGKGLCAGSGAALGEFKRVSAASVCAKNGDAVSGPVMYRMVVKFFPLTRGIWNFHLGSTFAEGGVVFVDGKSISDTRGRKFAWGGSWADKANIISTGEVELAPKRWHTVDIFGFGAKDGKEEPMDMQFQYRPAAGWRGGEAPWKIVEARSLQEACD
jgi:hypothetical protein